MNSLVDFDVIPDVFDSMPARFAQVIYENGEPVGSGNMLTPTQVKNMPSVSWGAEEGGFYTLLMTDPDAPSKENPKFREWHHWLVVNIPGGRVDKGETLSEYVGAGPPKGTGYHRYIFVVFQQPGKLSCDEPRLTNRSGANRAKFSTRKFAEKYGLGQPIAANFFRAQWDTYVPELYKQLGD